MAITIRPASSRDQATIRRMIRQANLNPMNLRWPNFLIAEDEQREIVGVGQVKPHADGSRELASLAVSPARQGQGIGTRLVNELIAEHADQTLHLTCRRSLQPYYERFGFRRVPQKDYPPYFRRLLLLVNVVARIAGTQIVLMRRDPDR